MFIFSDLLIFTAFFLSFLHERGQDLVGFSDAKSHINQTFGTINTLLLLCSSWFVALGIQNARVRLDRLAQRQFIAAAACGLGFAAIKIFEYREKILAGILPNSSEFFNYYYILTGIHFFHVLLGLAVLFVMSRYSRFPLTHQTSIAYLECGASFWHLVDLLWIVLFALLYLVP